SNKIVKELDINTISNQILVECKAWEEGIYRCEKLINKNVVATQQIIINRGSLSNDLLNTDNLSKSDYRIFPNPTRDYFFVKTRLFEGSSIKITNNIGQTIGVLPL